NDGRSRPSLTAAERSMPAGLGLSAYSAPKWARPCGKLLTSVGPGTLASSCPASGLKPSVMRPGQPNSPSTSSPPWPKPGEVPVLNVYVPAPPLLPGVECDTTAGASYAATP